MPPGSIEPEGMRGLFAGRAMSRVKQWPQDACSRRAGQFSGPASQRALDLGGIMPQSSRYPVTELPRTLQRSGSEAQETFLRELDNAVRIHGEGDQAYRIAYTTLKRNFEKRGDHWIAKHDPEG